MSGILAMAGLAEVAFFYGMLLIGAVLLVTVGLFALAWWRRSIVAAIANCAVLALVAYLLQPWSAIKPEQADDSDEAYWLFWIRVASMVWLLFALTSAGLLVKLIRHPKLRRNDLGRKAQV